MFASISDQQVLQSGRSALTSESIAVNESLGLSYSDKYFEDMIGDVQKVLEPLSLEFRQMMSEDDGQPICAIVCYFCISDTYESSLILKLVSLDQS